MGFFYYFFHFIEFIGVRVVKNLYGFKVHNSKTSSVHCIVCSPPQVESPYFTIYPPFTLFYTFELKETFWFFFYYHLSHKGFSDKEILELVPQPRPPPSQAVDMRAVPWTQRNTWEASFADVHNKRCALTTHSVFLFGKSSNLTWRPTMQ